MPTDAVLPRHTGLVCDLDGVVYRGRGAVPGAVEALSRWRACGRQVVFATNNASRPAAEVAEHLGALGCQTREDEVLTSAQVGAHYLAERFPTGSRVLAVGGPGVTVALGEVGLHAVGEYSDPVVAVLQGYGTDVRARDLNEAAFAVAGGALWVATNTDRTIPTGRGIGPGNGMFVAAVGEPSGFVPVVVGKPEPAMATGSAARMELAVLDCLAVGDRLDTDILGGQRCGMETLWVLSGVHTLVDLLAFDGVVPTYVAADLGVLGSAPLVPVRDVSAWAPGRWRSGAVEVALDEVRVAVTGWDPDLGAPSSDTWAAATAAVLSVRDRVVHRDEASAVLVRRVRELVEVLGAVR